MVKKLRNGILSILRRLVATDELMYRQERIYKRLYQRQHQMLLSLGNALKYSTTDTATVKETLTYKRCAGIVSLLTPMDVVDAKYVRIGRDGDGGYVMLDDFECGIEAAYSFGIFDDVSWDEDIANLGIDVFMFDHTIDQLPKSHPKFHYFKAGVTGRHRGPRLKTLLELIEENNHSKCNNLILKMDIEGNEWDVFEEASEEVINHFSQMVLEIHGLAEALAGSTYSRITEVLAKINKTHQCIHVHANNHHNVPILWIRELVLPPVLEVTYVRRADFTGRLTKNTRQFPGENDQPNTEDFPDIYLGGFCVEDGEMSATGFDAASRPL